MLMHYKVLSSILIYHPHLNTCITYFTTFIRLSAPCIAYRNTLSRLHILIHEFPMLKHYVGFGFHILKPCIAYPITLPSYSLS